MIEVLIIMYAAWYLITRFAILSWVFLSEYTEHFSWTAALLITVFFSIPILPELAMLGLLIDNEYRIWKFKREVNK